MVAKAIPDIRLFFCDLELHRFVGRRQFARRRDAVHAAEGPHDVRRLVDARRAWRKRITLRLAESIFIGRGDGDAAGEQRTHRAVLESVHWLGRG